jgi:hypothetical protein
MICTGLDLTGFKNLSGLLFQQQSRIKHSRTKILICFVTRYNLCNSEKKSSQNQFVRIFCFEIALKYYATLTAWFLRI